MIGTLYFIQEGPAGAIKIGWTQNSVEQRRIALQTGNSEELRLIGVIRNVRRHVENQWHKRYHPHLKRSEWFYPTASLVSAIAAEAQPQVVSAPAPVVIQIRKSPEAVAHAERISRLIADVRSFGAAMGWSDTTVSRRVFNDGKEIARLEGGAGTMPARLDRHEATLAAMLSEYGLTPDHAVSA